MENQDQVQNREENIIYFFDENSSRVLEKYYCLNNFFISPFTCNGRDYQTVEHYYQVIY